MKITKFIASIRYNIPVREQFTKFYPEAEISTLIVGGFWM